MENPRGCWRVCIGATIAMFCVVGICLNTFSVYVPYLKEQCALTYTQSSLILLLRNFLGMFSIVFVHKYYEKLDVRVGVAAAFGLAILGMVLYSVADSFWDLCVAGVCTGLAYGLGGAYPASILMHRWFKKNLGLAIGLSSASTGIATTICAPIVTALVENHSLKTAMQVEIVFLLAAMTACFLLIRNWPQGKKPAAQPDKQNHNGKKGFRISWMLIAALLIGFMGDPGFQNVSMLYSSRSFAPYQVAFLVSMIGFGLMISKFMMGSLADRWGGFRTNWLFFGLVIVGSAMNFIPGTYGFSVAAVGLLSAGSAAMSTVGLAIFAKDLSAEEEFPQVYRQFQLCYLLGGFVGGAIPGALADWTGNYGTYYGLMAVWGCVALAIVQIHYKKKTH